MRKVFGGKRKVNQAVINSRENKNPPVKGIQTYQISSLKIKHYLYSLHT